ncbi:MAG: hypothetical protein L0H55_15705 [Candidatus Nitrosocosmicus sp.]|nr:hypothetical protein [Candidatus Nitrosocosmicus sp.]
MRNSNIKLQLHNNHHHKLSTKLVLIIIVSGFLGVSSLDLTYNNITAQTLQEKCTPDMGTNISKSNCFSNTSTNPVYNVQNTDNVRPPSENTPSITNNSNSSMNTSTK